MKTDSIEQAQICMGVRRFVRVCAALLGQNSCEMVDAVKMYYSDKVDQEIAKYYFGDPVMLEIEILDFFIFSTQSIFNIFFEKCRKSA